LEALETATPRPTLSHRAAYRLARGVIGLGLFASVTPTPLYSTYSGLWHFSPLTLTLIYATYAFALVTTAFVGAYLLPEPVRTRGRFRLTVQRPRVPAFEIFGSVVAAIGLVVAFEAWRQRSGSHRHSTEPKEAQLEQAS
jgi:hypothetical protein